MLFYLSSAKLGDSMESDQHINITYDFAFENGKSLSYQITLDRNSMTLVTDNQQPPEWTRLENKKCSHCPLNPETQPYCPVAKNLNHLVNHFKETKSIWKTNVTVHTEDRNFQKNTDMQTALFSVFGLIMATSPCPFMEFLKPMARFHLPFSNMDETMVRATSMYLLKQYYVAKDGGQPDIQLSGLEKAYENLNKVNLGIIKRIRELGKGDTQSNAITILDCFAQMLSMEITHDLKGIRHLVENKVAR